MPNKRNAIGSPSRAMGKKSRAASRTGGQIMQNEEITQKKDGAGRRRIAKKIQGVGHVVAEGPVETTDFSSGSWSCWEDDGHCSNTCGNGTQIRRRRCNNPAPTIDGDECPGENVTNVPCNMKECPVYKWGHLKELNLTKDDLKEMMKEELNQMKSNLTIDPKNISASIRKRISARDDRPSAASVGYVGVALLMESKHIARDIKSVDKENEDLTTELARISSFQKCINSEWNLEKKEHLFFFSIYFVNSAEVLNMCTLEPREPCSNSCGSGYQNISLFCDDWRNEFRFNFTATCTSSTGCTGGWSVWTTFGECSTTCDEGRQVVKRRCDNPLPGRDAAYCDGSWSCWEDDGHCSTSCGNGTQLRRRRCNNPAPTNGGETCPGDILTKVHCNTKECPVYKWGHLKELNLTQNDLKEIMEDEMNEMKNNLTIDSKNISAAIRKRISARDDRLSAASVGRWGDWTAFGECSTSCDGGQKLFIRTCNHGSLPGHLSVACDGENYEYKTCNLGGCPGSWAVGRMMVTAPTSCGNGTQIRRRRCDNLAPTNVGNECPDDNVTKHISARDDRPSAASVGYLNCRSVGGSIGDDYFGRRSKGFSVVASIYRNVCSRNAQ
ncbi:unnamed protein product [Mytilus edulis]|uniref:Uncharacterized protein n=1 Tax=Mytilus edulis TaxID=6550 RepID=A0A8S3TV49_MYTED|nr:unnamed protein product [Mytilus edulis]